MNENEIETTATTTRGPIRLATLAIELDTTVDELAHRLGRDVFVDSVGFRVCTAFRASELFRERERQREALARRTAEAAERRRPPVPAGVDLTVPEGLTPAQAMVAADGPALYEGGVHRPTPGPLDWQFGSGEGGGTFGPTRRQMAEQARERAETRKRERGAK